MLQTIMMGVHKNWQPHNSSFVSFNWMMMIIIIFIIIIRAWLLLSRFFAINLLLFVVPFHVVIIPSNTNNCLFVALMLIHRQFLPSH